MAFLKIITILWLVFMLWLSHTPGSTSSAESRWLSTMTGVNEGVLRRAMHVVVYMILGVLVVLAFPEVSLWVRAVVLAIIAVVDEGSKALRCFSGRHCSVVPDMILNLVGVAIGIGIGMLIQNIAL